MEIYFLLLGKEETQRALPAPPASRVTTVQNSQRAIVVYVGAACPAARLTP